jgi:hypothetical protein
MWSTDFEMDSPHDLIPIPVGTRRLRVDLTRTYGDVDELVCQHAA